MPPIAGIPTTVLVAPDSFKGTFSALEVAGAAGRGLQAGGFPVDLCPVADGGEGTLEALIEALDGERRHATVTDPLGREVRASFGIGGSVAIVDTAAASGLGLLGPDERDAMRASTAGTGELILAAMWAGARPPMGAAARSERSAGAEGCGARGSSSCATCERRLRMPPGCLDRRKVPGLRTCAG